MTKEQKTFSDLLQSYSEQTQDKYNHYYKVMMDGISADTPDVNTVSKAMGGIAAIQIYDGYLDIMFGNEDKDIEPSCGVITRQFVEKEHQRAYSDEEFDEWIEDNQDWLHENSQIPDIPSSFPLLMNWMEDFITDEMLAPESNLNIGINERAPLEFADFDRDALNQGILEHLHWIRTTLVPDLMPQSWNSKNAKTSSIFRSPKQQLN